MKIGNLKCALVEEGCLLCLKPLLLFNVLSPLPSESEYLSGLLFISYPSPAPRARVVPDPLSEVPGGESGGARQGGVWCGGLGR